MCFFLCKPVSSLFLHAHAPSHQSHPYVPLQSIDLSVLLLAVHKFFDALGSEEIRRRGAREDKPLRMVKTVLHEVCSKGLLRIGSISPMTTPLNCSIGA